MALKYDGDAAKRVCYAGAFRAAILADLLMSLMRKFLYRFPRLKTECAMDLIVGDSVVIGTCLDLSESGLRGTFADPVSCGTEGLLTLYQGERNVQVPALVYAVSEAEARIRFQIGSDQERLALRDFMNLLNRS